MLNQLRQSARSWIIKALFAILVLSFAVWGIGDIFRGPGRATVVASVGEREISGNELAAAFNRQIERLRPYFDGDLDAERARELGILDGVLQRILTRALFNEAARDLGIRVSDAVVRATIAVDPNFKGTGGEFDRFVFEQALRQAGYSEQAYVEELRQDLAREQLMSAIRLGASPPEVLVDSLYRFRNEKRVADVVTVANSSITDVPEPGQATLRAFHEEHADLFTAPEYRAVTAIALSPEDIAGEIKVPEEELRETYETNKQRFVKPERRRLQQMVLSGEEDAQQAYEMLNEGRDFAAVAEEITGEDAASLDLGWNTREDLPPDLAEAAFDAPENGVTEPVETALGWHIVKVTKVEPGQVTAFEEAREDLRKEIAAEKAVDSLYNLSIELEDTLAAGATLEEAARQLGLRLIEIKAMDPRGRDREGNEIADLPGGDKFFNTAFATSEGQQSLLTETPDGGYFILRVDEVTPPQLRPLDEARDDVLAEWQAEQRAKLAEAKAKDIMHKVEGGGSLETVAEEMGLEVTRPDPVSRTGGQFSADLVSELFEAQPGEAVMAETGPGYSVAQLEEIIPANPATDPDGVRDLREQLQSNLASDLIDQFAAALHARYPVEVNAKAIDSLF